MVAERVDLVVLSRDETPLPNEVLRGISQQDEVCVCLHRVFGRPSQLDRTRFVTIAKARNHGKSRGNSPWLMFLDDDVVLPKNCIANLLNELKQRRDLGAIAADYLGEAITGQITSHVAMGATLFRRNVLEKIAFRWQPGCCDCQCCCDDLRHQMIGIAYSNVCKAKHLNLPNRSAHRGGNDGDTTDAAAYNDLAPRILVAFDRRQFVKFRTQFLVSLRESGNDEQVIAVGYGMYPSHQRTAARLNGVEALPFPFDPSLSPVRHRLRDFQVALTGLNPQTPVAYWDTSKVIFQDRLSELWRMVKANPEKLLTTKHALRPHHNPVVESWVRTILDPRSSEPSDKLLVGKPMLNGEFVASTAQSMMAYLRAAHDACSRTRTGATGNDQVPIDPYGNNNADRWVEIDEAWNFCSIETNDDEICRHADGCHLDQRGTPVRVVHDN